MISASLLWVILGLIVIYQIGIGELIAAIKMESAISGVSEEGDSPFAYGVYLFIVLLFWPLIWVEYIQTRN